MTHIRVLTINNMEQVLILADASRREGFRFVQRFVDDLLTTALDAQTQWFFGVFDGDELRAIGGVTPDPYAQDTEVGRIHRVYVASALQRHGYGSLLLDALEARALHVYPILRLRT